MQKHFLASTFTRPSETGTTASSERNESCQKEAAYTLNFEFLPHGKVEKPRPPSPTTNGIPSTYSSIRCNANLGCRASTTCAQNVSFQFDGKKIVRGGPSGTPLGRPLSYVCQLAVGHAGEQPPVTNKIQHQKSKPNHETISKIMLFRHRCMDGKKANPNCATRPNTRVIQNPNSNCSRNAARVTLYPSFSRIIYPQHKAPCGTKRSFHKHIQAYIGASQFSGQSR